MIRALAFVLLLAPGASAAEKECAQARAMRKKAVFSASSGEEKLARAEKTLREALDIAKAGECPSADLLALCGSLARLHEIQERWPLAVRYRADALGLVEKEQGDGSPAHAEAEAELAATYRKAGQSREAIAHYERARKALAKTAKHEKRAAELAAILAELREETKNNIR